MSLEVVLKKWKKNVVMALGFGEIHAWCGFWCEKTK